MATPDPTRGRQATSQRTDTALNLLADASILGVNDSIHHSPVDMNYGATVWARSDVPEAQSIADLELEGEMLRRALHEHQLGQTHAAFERYEPNLNLGGFESQSTPSSVQSFQRPPNIYIPPATYSMTTPNVSTPSTPFFLPSSPAAFTNPFEVGSSTQTTYNQNYFDPALTFQAPPPKSQSPTAILAEEDKRQRNSAASARFRAKRKQREEALQAESRLRQQSLQELETRARSLEAENKFLRRLLVEKDAGLKGSEQKEAADDGNVEGKQKTND